ncbi:hypothetical protein [Chromobacterium sphagni]|uniref:Uncharacterized protein n=1 Tax=Chromobacterium sphagni TaxID=1903179 RepID=A0A1S1X265_9NEIS|nr:hypothetical protein [Chromobacterium sphagni]OHX13539.1 hypothetical protein BI347_08440 [Chromobacterium sphagni]OHX21995.1 hypothetical protein BI344_05730 [Chromobacterium sphagni]
MFGFWRLWLLATILALGWALVCFALTGDRGYLRRMRGIARWSGGLLAIVACFWLIFRLLR